MRKYIVTAVLAFGLFLVAGADAPASQKQADSFGEAISLIPTDPQKAEAMLAKSNRPIALAWRMYVVFTTHQNSPEREALLHDLTKKLEVQFKRIRPDSPGKPQSMLGVLEYLMSAYQSERMQRGECIPAWLFVKHPIDADRASWVGGHSGTSAIFIVNDYCPIPDDGTIMALPEFTKYYELLGYMYGSAPSHCDGTLRFVKNAVRWKWRHMLKANLDRWDAPVRYPHLLTEYEEYLPIWANKGLWEKHKVKEFYELRTAARASIVRWIQDNYSYSREKIEALATRLINEVASSSTGRFSSYELEVLNKSWYRLASKPGATADDMNVVLPSKPIDLNQALRVSVLNNQPTEVIELLHSAGATLEKSEENETILAVDNAPYLEQMLTLGAKVDHATCFGKTALFYAVQFNFLESAEVLIANGANVNRKTTKANKGLTWGDPCKCKNLPVGGRTPLIYACWQGSLKGIKLLLEQGADPSLADTKGKTAIDYLDKNETMTPAEIKAARKLLSS